MEKLFTSLVVMLPIITVYRSPINGIDLGTFVFMILSIFILFYRKTKVSIIKTFLIFLVYVVLSTLISISIQGNIENSMILPRTLKFIFLIVLILFIGYKKLFNINFAFKTLKIVTNIAVIYIILQTIMYKIFSILLPNGLITLLTYNGYSKLDYVSIAMGFYRPSSFFIESASFAQYSLLYLCYSIFGWNSDKLINEWKQAVFISFGIILSGSGQGLLLLAFIWGIWLLTRVFTLKLSYGKVTLFIIIIFVGTFAMKTLLQTELISKTLTRVFTDNAAGGGNAIIARIGGYAHFNMLPNIFKLIGVGYGNVPMNIYFNSASYLIYCNGILGGIIVIYILVDAFIKGKSFQRIFLVVFSVLMLGANVFTAANICFYFSFIYSDELKKTINN